MEKDVYILAIESSCDETAAAVVKNGRDVCSNVIHSQIALHTEYGGVVPEIASRKHIEKINQVMGEALTQAGKKLTDMDAIAAAVVDNEWFGPGETALTTWALNLFDFRETAQSTSVPGEPSPARPVSQTCRKCSYFDPRPVSTTQTVWNRILISSPSVQLSIYSRSSFTTSSKSTISLLPLICQSPVSPGVILILRL